jgi:hypothetical protein
VPREALRVAAPLRPAALRLAEVLRLVVPLFAVLLVPVLLAAVLLVLLFVVVAMLMVNPSRVLPG